MKPISLSGERGFSLVEILVAIALLAFVSQGISSVLANSLKGARNLQSKADLDSLVNTLKLVIGDEGLCPSSLSDFRLAAKSIPVPTAAAVRRGGTLIAQVGQRFPAFFINRLELTELDPTARLPDGPGRTRFLANLVVEVTKTAGSLGAPKVKQNFVLRVTTLDATGTIQACGLSTEAKSQFVTASVRLTKSYAPGCDGASSPANECYCGGLETVHRAKPPGNLSGTPYGHGSADPFNTERPRPWVGEIECPDGYVAGVAGADCGPIAGTGKLENITPLSARRVRIGCCVYTSDAVPNGTEAKGALKLVCYRG